MTTDPILKNFMKSTSSPSQRIERSHRIVASEPVIDRFGPRSTPISMASITRSGLCACNAAALAASPAGRLLIALLPSAMASPDVVAAAN